MKKTNRVWLKGIVAALAFAGLSSLSHAEGAFKTPDNAFSGAVMFSATPPGPVYSGTEVTVSGRNFRQGQLITLERGSTVLNAQPYVVSEDGTFRGTVSIPEDAVVGLQPIVVKVAGPDAALVVDLKVSPQVPLSGQEQYDLTAIQPAAGLYQSAYSSKNNALFVTAAVGRPPVSDAHLLRVNPDNMEVVASIEPATANERTGLYAPYGIGLDDEKETVWVTAGRQGSVTVYNQSDLSLVKQFEMGIVPGGRDVVVGGTKVFISSPGGSDIYVFDTEKLELTGTITIRSQMPRQAFKPMSLAFDAASQRLYTVSLATPEVAVINTSTNAVEHVFTVPGLKNGSGIAADARNARIYVVGQNTDGMMILDANTGDLLHTVATGAGSLNVVFNPVDGLAYVANRAAGTVTAVNAEGEIVANLDIGTLPNHLSVDAQGRVFVVNKARGEDDPRGNQLTRIVRK